MNMRSFCFILFFTFWFMPVLGGVVPYAQEADIDTDEFTLDEITATAQKRTKNKQKMHIAMDVVNGGELTLSGKTNVANILGNLN